MEKRRVRKTEEEISKERMWRGIGCGGKGGRVHGWRGRMMKDREVSATLPAGD